MKPAAKVRFSNDPFDQWRAAKVGATIGFDKHGKAEFRFQTWDQYRKYMELNTKREEFEERRKQA